MFLKQKTLIYDAPYFNKEVLSKTENKNVGLNKTQKSILMLLIKNGDKKSSSQMVQKQNYKGAFHRDVECFFVFDTVRSEGLVI